MNEPLHVKYRPAELDDVIGQDAVVRSLRQLWAGKRMPHTYLFTGPSGTGKTTLARIVAGMVGAGKWGTTEVDAARYSGIDQMRELLANAQFVGLGDAPERALIIDECHALSKSTWQTLLLSTEEPPKHLYFFFCTTEPDKVPKTIRTRAHAYDLKPVKWDLLAEYCEQIADTEKLTVPVRYIELACRKADGSVRQALVYLSVLDGITDIEQARQLLETVDEATGGPVELARMLVTGNGATWPNARKLIEQMADVPPETIRLVVLNYTMNALMKTDSPGQAGKLLAILQAFSGPCNASEKLAPILLAVGTLLL